MNFRIQSIFLILWIFPFYNGLEELPRLDIRPQSVTFSTKTVLQYPIMTCEFPQIIRPNGRGNFASMILSSCLVILSC